MLDLAKLKKYNQTTSKGYTMNETEKIELAQKAHHVASDLAQQAGNILLDYQKKLTSVKHKSDGAGLVTEADEQAEKFLIESLNNHFPQIGFLAEESGETAAKSPEQSGEQSALNQIRWIIDPLDGTNNYAHHVPWFCVSIGLEIDQEIYMGIIHHPVLKETFSAIKGQGAFLNQEKIQVSKINKLEDALLTVGFYYYKDTVLQQEIARFEKVHQKVLGIRRPGSAALDIAYTAAGRFDGYWERGLNPWDMAAGFLIAQEAGARISKYNGSAVTIYDKEILLTNGIIHQELMDIIQ